VAHRKRGEAQGDDVLAGDAQKGVNEKRKISEIFEAEEEREPTIRNQERLRRSRGFGFQQEWGKKRTNYIKFQVEEKSAEKRKRSGQGNERAEEKEAAGDLERITVDKNRS